MIIIVDNVKLNPLFHDLDRSAYTPSRAPTSHERHVTDMGRADTSLAPSGHHKHVIDSASIFTTASPAPLTTRNIELQKRPMVNERWSPALSPTSLGDVNLSSYLPEQILTPRDASSASSSILEIPKLTIDEPKGKRNDKVQKRRKSNSGHKSPKRSPSLPMIEKELYREGSPLPQQILTPRIIDDIMHEHETRHKPRAKDGKPSAMRKKKPKDDLIDKDRNLLRIYNRNGTDSPIRRSPSPQVHHVSGMELGQEISDIDV